MDLSKILSISGKSGLYKVISQMKNAVLVESLTDKHRFPAFSHEKVSSLEEIAVFTASEDKPLKEILKAMFEKEGGKPAIDAKSDNKQLQAYFLEVVPDYDTDRVYISDIRKIISWYNLLAEQNLLDFTEKDCSQWTFRISWVRVQCVVRAASFIYNWMNHLREVDMNVFPKPSHEGLTHRQKEHAVAFANKSLPHRLDRTLSEALVLGLVNWAGLGMLATGAGLSSPNGMR